MIKTIPDKAEWPKTVDKTTDWETLFENKENGFIALVLATDTPALLKSQTETIIRTIFNRKRDQALLNKLTAFLGKIIPDDASDERFPTMQLGVRQLLEKIKEDRVKRAAISVTRKAKKKKSKKEANRRANLVTGFFRRSNDALGIVFGLMKKKPKAKKRGKKTSREKSDTSPEKDAFYQQAAYVDDGGDGDTEWQDNDLATMKEGDADKAVVFEDDVKEEGGDKYESWDDY